MNNIINDLLGTDSKPAILAGAGISIDSPSNLLSGYAMMKGIIEHAVLDTYITQFLDYMTAPPHSSDKPGDFLRFELLIHRLRKHDPNLTVLNCLKDCRSPNLNHYALANLVISGHPVMTTNFDSLIETAYDNIKNDFSKELNILAYQDEFDDFIFNSNHHLLKIHGSFTRKGRDISDSIQAEYTKVLTNNYSGKGKCISDLLSGYDLVVVGYSGSDDLDIIPVLAESGRNRIVWVRHSNSYRDITDEVYRESAMVKSKFHALGLHKLMYDKGREYVRVIEAPTNQVLCSLLPQHNVDEIKKAVAGHTAYSIPENYFEEWAGKAGINWTTKYFFTKTLYEDKNFDRNPDFDADPGAPSNDEADSSISSFVEEYLASDSARVNIITREFNRRGRNRNEELLSWYKELCQIERRLQKMQVPSLYNIKGCIEYELGKKEDAEQSFRSVLHHYEAVHNLESMFILLNDMDKRHLLTEQENNKMNTVLRNIGFYPVVWGQKFMEYAGILAPVHSYLALVDEIGEHLLNYNQAVRDLLLMKRYSIAMGDVVGERNIDRLLWKLDYFEKGIADDFARVGDE